jgi:hypothetical protein
MNREYDFKHQRQCRTEIKSPSTFRGLEYCQRTCPIKLMWHTRKSMAVVPLLPFAILPASVKTNRSNSMVSFMPVSAWLEQ